MTRRAVVLLSGGLDSATCLALARRDGYDPLGLAVDYGQRHRVELECSRRLADAMGCGLNTVRVDLRAFGGSALTDEIDVPKGRDEAAMADAIPVTYVPARNLVFLSLAVAQAEAAKASAVYIGVNQLDYSGYPDCRGAFIEAFRKASTLATKAGVEGEPIEIVTPLIDMTKAEIIRLGVSLGVDYAMTSSCYDPDELGRACGSCDSCTLRKRGFEDAGAPDPTVYA